MADKLPWSIVLQGSSSPPSSKLEGASSSNAIVLTTPGRSRPGEHRPPSNRRHHPQQSCGSILLQTGPVQVTETVGFLSSRKNSWLVAGSSYSKSSFSAEEPYVSYFHCDGRRDPCEKRSDCHPGNHSSFLSGSLCLSPRWLLSSVKEERARRRLLVPLSSFTCGGTISKPLSSDNISYLILLMRSHTLLTGRREPFVSKKSGLVAGSSSTTLLCSSRFPMPCSQPVTANAPIRTLLLI